MKSLREPPLVRINHYLYSLNLNFAAHAPATVAMGMFSSKEKKGTKGPKFAVPDAQDKAMLELHRSKNRIQKYSARVGGP